MGAIQALEELGVLPYLKRFAGASAGSCAGMYVVAFIRCDTQPHTLIFAFACLIIFSIITCIGTICGAGKDRNG